MEMVCILEREGKKCKDPKCILAGKVCEYLYLTVKDKAALMGF